MTKKKLLVIPAAIGVLGLLAFIAMGSPSVTTSAEAAKLHSPTTTIPPLTDDNNNNETNTTTTTTSSSDNNNSNSDTIVVPAPPTSPSIPHSRDTNIINASGALPRKLIPNDYPTIVTPDYKIPIAYLNYHNIPLRSYAGQDYSKYVQSTSPVMVLNTGSMNTLMFAQGASPLKMGLVFEDVDDGTQIDYSISNDTSSFNTWHFVINANTDHEDGDEKEDAVDGQLALMHIGISFGGDPNTTTQYVQLVQMHIQ